MTAFVGRAEPLARLGAAYAAASSGWAGLTLVTGEAGIGKTALLRRFAADAAADGATVTWGTCWDGDQAPAWWPWTQALRDLRRLVDVPDSELPDVLGLILPELAGAEPGTSDAAAADRLRAFDAVVRLLARAAANAPLVVILDDLQWSDGSTVDLLRFLGRRQHQGRVLLVGAYRPGEARDAVASALAGLATAGELIPLQSLSSGEVEDLVRAVTDKAGARRWAGVVHQRSGGHPFFARELCHLLETGHDTEVPAVVRDVILRRLARLSDASRAVLDVAAVAGRTLLPDVLADATGESGASIAGLVGESAAAGVVLTDSGSGVVTFAHDLYRETIYADLAGARRLDLHHRVAEALVRRHDRGSQVFPAELAHHFAHTVTISGPEPAVSWAIAAAEADRRRAAFGEAAAHLTRARSAVADAGCTLSDGDLVRLLTTEADLWLRSGDTGRARHELDTAWQRARVTGKAELLGLVALGLDQCGARFAMPRADLVAVLDTALAATAGSGTPLEAQVTAALARQLQHSVPADRPRAAPLAARSVTIARTLDDPSTLASCLLAHHDAVWRPGTSAERLSIATEIADLATAATDVERQAQALLLKTTAQLESGSPAFRASLAEFSYLTEQLREPRHDYVLRTRQAALALLEGDLDEGERLSAEAAELGEAVGDSDTGNVRMSQRLEVVRARGDADDLRATAEQAVRWWIGAPAHAHAIAAGFRARAGDLTSARRELDTVLALDDWRTDRSYLWSVFVGEMAVAAIALDDRPLCQELLDDLVPMVDGCAVNAAFITFMGAHAHRIGLLQAALGDHDRARESLTKAVDIHRRLGARGWEAESAAALASLDSADPVLRRAGDLWEARYAGRTAFVRHTKGVQDLAVLLARPRVDVAALELAGALDAPRDAGADPVLDRTAVASYRQRLEELDDELAESESLSDTERARAARDERDLLLAELRASTRPGGVSRPLGPSAAERARKAVSARIRDAIRRIEDVHPELGRHLDRTVRTGSLCRYDDRDDRPA